MAALPGCHPRPMVGQSTIICKGIWRLASENGSTEDPLPELPGRERGAFSQRFELHPYDLGVDLDAPGESPEAAIDPGDHALRPNDAGILEDAVGDQLGMLDDVGGRVDDARNDDLVGGQRDLAP